jgi:pilus assembly protein Flp/PilA
MRKKLSQERGQGLVEYALILVLVAIVVVGILLTMGPTIGNLFSDIKDVLLAGSGGGGSSVITGASASRSGSTVRVSVSVSTSTTISISTGSGTVSPSSQTCNGSCTFTITGVPGAGSATVSGGGESTTARWN